MTTVPPTVAVGKIACPCCRLHEATVSDFLAGRDHELMRKVVPPFHQHSTPLSMHSLLSLRFCDTLPLQSSTDGATKDFYIESSLGHGSFGEVFRARHRRESSQQVALKIMDRSRIKVTSIQRELTVMEAMGTHPGIITYHGSYVSPEKVTFVLELMNGGELFERLVHKGAYTEAEARPAFRRIARGLAYLHSRGIVHRDLKVWRKPWIEPRSYVWLHCLLVSSTPPTPRSLAESNASS